MGNFPEKSKTFWAGLALMAMGIYLFATGDAKEGVELVLIGMGMMGIRHAIEKKEVAA